MFFNDSIAVILGCTREYGHDIIIGFKKKNEKNHQHITDFVKESMVNTWLELFYINSFSNFHSPSTIHFIYNYDVSKRNISNGGKQLFVNVKMLFMSLILFKWLVILQEIVIVIYLM